MVLLSLAMVGCLSEAPESTAPQAPSVDSPPPEPPSIPIGPPRASGPAVECEVDELDPPRVFGAKVKTLLTGLPLTAEELRRLTRDPAELTGLTESWMETDAFRDVMISFFRLAFQQNASSRGLADAIGVANLIIGLYPPGNRGIADLYLDNLRHSFARTAFRILDEGRPWTEVLTTETFEMTTGLMVLQAYTDRWYRTDDGEVRYLPWPELDTTLNFYRTAEEAPPLLEALNPASPNFLHLPHSRVGGLSCLSDADRTLTVEANELRRMQVDRAVFFALIGRAPRIEVVRDGQICSTGTNQRTTPLLDMADFSDWRPVHLRPVAADEEPSRFYRLDLLRGATDMAVASDRVGFFTTMGFFMNWPTNPDNQARVTLNQTLITALGHSFDGVAVPGYMPENIDPEHSGPGTACYGCHQTLDPMREFFRRSYTYSYGIQDDPQALSERQAKFIFRGVQGDGSDVRDLARILAGHPDFPRAWVHKMCHFATGEACPENDIFDGIAERFAADMDFKRMLVALLTSPLVIHTQCVANGMAQRRSISRRSQFCTALTNRLGLDRDHDFNKTACSLDWHYWFSNNLQRRVRPFTAGLPMDDASRGDIYPTVVMDPGLVSRGSRDLLCGTIATSAYDQISSGLSEEEFVQKMVSVVMGLPEGDPRHTPAINVLRRQMRAVRAQGESETVARQSVFTTACMSPGMAGMGF